jgi:hypothetical protein
MATEQYYIWYEMAMVQNTYGTKWFLVMVRNCNSVVRNGNGTKWLWYEMVSGRSGPKSIRPKSIRPQVDPALNLNVDSAPFEIKYF